MAGATVASATLLDVMTGAAPATAVTDGLTRPAERAASGQSVVVLGAGPAGLTAALKFAEAGYKVTVLEATRRVGGRTLTARPNDQVTEVWDDGSLRTQTCNFDKGLYLNLGAGRIPYHHQRVLNLCRRLKVPLEPYIHTTTANLFQSDKGWQGATRPNRRIANDTRGYVAQLLTQALQKGLLDDGLTPAQRDQFVKLLVPFGKLDKDSKLYVGSTRSGLAKPISVHQMEEAIDPLLLKDLLASEFWDQGFYQDSDWHWHTTSFQPVGGMDTIWRYAAAALPSGAISYSSPVSSIQLDGNGVIVTWSTNGGAAQTRRFDYCLSNIPVSVLRDQVTLSGNFSPDFKNAVKRTPFAPACKVGWQANRRFWESDKYQIYGGISRIDHEISQIWYPSNDYFSVKGTMTGAYNSYEKATTLGDRPHDERLSVARAAGIKLHDEMASNAVIPNQLGMSIAWHKVQYQLGAWADWAPSKPELKPLYETLLYPQGQDNFFVIGDQVSALPGWQEGALMSAEWAFESINSQKRAPRMPVKELPNARELTTGESGPSTPGR
ncbi:flavin monoamine oxidase family protein [Streptomyces sp. NPDC101160]|uniref:flavin monoamine oxidase family protein n=1 Tax=Streptomyces sp. NPDC101160 TaxID=3366118 RepID=UPI00382518D3